MKIIIKESVLKKILLENETVILNYATQIADFLDKNYMPSVEKIEKNGEFVDRHVFTKKINKDVVNALDMLDYLDYKFNDLSDDENYRKNFLKQILKDWYSGFWQKNKMLSSMDFVK